VATGTPITLDKVRTLRFTIDAVDELERALGVGLDQLWQTKQRIVALVALLYHGLKHEDTTLSEKRVRKLLQAVIDRGEDISAINETVLEALFASGVYGRDLAAKAGELRAEKAEEAAVDPPPVSDADA
jgi:hypothetical protein